MTSLSLIEMFRCFGTILFLASLLIGLGAVYAYWSLKVISNRKAYSDERFLDACEFVKSNGGEEKLEKIARKLAILGILCLILGLILASL